MPSPSFAFLLLEEHPYGREMLARIAAAGHVPDVIVEERSDVADSEREKFLARIAGHRVAPTIAEQADALGVRVVAMAKHSSDALVALLGTTPRPDLIVLGGTRIIRGAILALPRFGVVNSHPGLLPECRGSASPAWSVLHDIPIGATVHLVDAGVDTGDVLLRRELAVPRGTTYEDLCHGTLVLAGTLMAEALEAYARGDWPSLRRPQAASPHPTFKNASEEVLVRVRAKLADGSYAHFVDRGRGSNVDPAARES